MMGWLRKDHLDEFFASVLIALWIGVAIGNWFPVTGLGDAAGVGVFTLAIWLILLSALITWLVSILRKRNKYMVKNWGPMVLKNPYDYSDRAPLLCQNCGWQGSGKEAGINIYHTVFDLSCPKCLEMLIVVPHPTDQQTMNEAAEGNEEAIRELATLKKYGALDKPE